MNPTLDEMRDIVNRANDLKNRIRKLKDILENLNHIGKITGINYEYYGKDKIGRFGSEIGDSIDVLDQISHETLGVSEQEFGEMFTEPIKGHLVYILDLWEKELEALG